MLSVKLISKTPNIEQSLVEIARVSSSREDKNAEPEKLISYLIKNKHWSPFEHGYMSFEVVTSIDISRQMLRHRSFTFQELSQRYQDVSKIHPEMFMPIEIRKQATNNRQSSTEVFDPVLASGYLASDCIADHLKRSEQLYKELLGAGVARECARKILPLATTTTLIMTANVRSWLHFLILRDDGHAQKEARDVAILIREHIKAEIPHTWAAFEKFLLNQQ